MTEKKDEVVVDKLKEHLKDNPDLPLEVRFIRTFWRQNPWALALVSNLAMGFFVYKCFLEPAATFFFGK